VWANVETVRDALPAAWLCWVLANLQGRMCCWVAEGPQEHVVALHLCDGLSVTFVC
jgi:hypothetical protein